MDRVGTTLMQKTGVIEKTVDKEFDDEERRFRNLEQKVDKLTHEAKGYLDAVRAMTIAQQRIADTINQFYDESARSAHAGLKYKEISNGLDEEVRTALDKEYRESVLDPLQKYNQYFPAVQEVIDRRQKKLLDYDSSRSKVRKLAERPSEDMDKLPKAERQALETKIMYEEVNNLLVEDVPKLIAARVPYLDPTFEALIKSQIKFATDAHVKMAELKRYFNRHGLGSADQLAQMNGQVESVLQQLRDFQIVTAGAASGPQSSVVSPQ